MKVRELKEKLLSDNSLIISKFADQFGELDVEEMRSYVRSTQVDTRGKKRRISIATIPTDEEQEHFREFYYLEDELVGLMSLTSSFDPEVNCEDLKIVNNERFCSFLQLLIQSSDITLDIDSTLNNIYRELKIYRELYITLWDYIINKSPNQNSELIIQLAEEELEKAKEQLDRIL